MPKTKTFPHKLYNDAQLETRDEKAEEIKAPSMEESTEKKPEQNQPSKKGSQQK
jgi:hypothetical protein